MIEWFKARRRRRILARPFPAGWTAILERNVAHWRFLDDAEEARLCARIQVFIAEKHWEGCGGLALTDEIRVTIAALACLLALGFERDPYSNVQSIFVYRSAVIAPGHSSRISGGASLQGPPIAISGQAMLGGPVVLTWDAVRRGATHPERGHNVVIHEFAHKLDMLDGGVDGTPPLASRAEHARWVEVCTREYEALRRGSANDAVAGIDAYGATHPGEFFAVVTEYFFAQPLAMKRGHAQLYSVLQDFYRQDPAAREARAARSAPRRPVPAGPPVRPEVPDSLRPLTAAEAPSRSGVARACLLALGLLSAALGAVGAFLPVLPTTPFVLLAGACFVRSSPALHRRLLANRAFGPYLAQWQRDRSVPLAAKRKAYGLVVASFSLSIALVDPPWLRGGLAVLGFALLVFLRGLPTTRDVDRA